MSENPTDKKDAVKDKEYYSTDGACKELKDKHETCFFVWYQKFINSEVKEMECHKEWDEYQACLKLKLEAHGLSEYLDPKRRIFDDDEQPQKK